MKKSWISKLLLLAGCTLAIHAQAALKEGKDYVTLASPQAVQEPGKLEVIEFFWYACSHCRALEPFLEQWSATLPKDVVLRRAHLMSANRPDLEGYSKIFLALQAMGLEGGKHQQAMFDAVQRDRLQFQKQSVLTEWLKKQGIDQKKFMASYDNFTSSIAVKKLENMTRLYRIEAVPTFIVNGKYMTSLEMAGSQPALGKIIEELLARERAMQKKK